MNSEFREFRVNFGDRIFNFRAYLPFVIKGID